MGDNNEILVEVRSVSKKLCRNLKLSLFYGLIDFLKLFFGIRDSKAGLLRKDEFWALRHIEFTLRRGECVGLIGHNGAGKSTLLKMLNGLIKPDGGQIIIRGKVGTLIDLEAGFNPLLTGRENIYVNGQLLGLTKREVDEKLQSIIDFSEIEKFIDTPVQNYSSGMKVRLGFSIAVQLEPDVLLIDEVLAVGDVGFVLKCFNKMDELKSKTAMIFVSHSMPQISRMCSKIILLKNGQSAFQTEDIGLGIARYFQLFSREIGNFHGSKAVEFEKISLVKNGVEVSANEHPVIDHGESFSIRILLNLIDEVSHPYLTVTFYDSEQKSFAEILNFDRYVDLDRVKGRALFTATLENIPFSKGRYSVSLDMTESERGVRRLVFKYQSALYFDVESKYQGWAPVQLEPIWEMHCIPGNTL